MARQQNTVSRSGGLGMTELLVAMVLGLFLVIAAAAIFVACRNAYLIQDDSIRLQDTGRFAIESIGRAVSQAGFTDPSMAQRGTSTPSAVAGLDNRTLKSTSPEIRSPIAKAINGSDVLALHFSGAGEGPDGDGSITNCAGFSVGHTDANSETDHGWSIFYIATDHTGEPELYCKYRGKHAWATAAIARGVESFQVLYGVSERGDGPPARFLNASQIDDLDRALPSESLPPEERLAEKNRQSYWEKISQIKVALLVRGAQPIRADIPTQRWQLFGDAYDAINADNDPGSRFNESDVPASHRNRLRKLFQADFRVRNVMPQSVP